MILMVVMVMVVMATVVVVVILAFVDESFTGALTEVEVSVLVLGLLSHSNCC